MKVGVFTVGLPDLTPEEAVREITRSGTIPGILYCENVSGGCLQSA